jgi:aromatic-L-amino-acid decarboxylase
LIDPSSYKARKIMTKTMRISEEELHMSDETDHPLMPGFDRRERLLNLASERINEFIDQTPRLPVSPAVTGPEIRKHLAGYDFESAIKPEDVLEDSVEMLTHWGFHVTHPRYFGLFNPSIAFMGVLADQLVAAFNPQVGVWHHSPIACEIELHLINFFLRLYGLDGERAGGSFTSGGSEANLMGMLLALTDSFPSAPQDGLFSLPGRPTIYVSRESHHSFVKMAAQCGLGRDAVRTVDVDGDLKMDIRSLAETVSRDRAEGLLPILVVGTAGTTGAGVIDPLPEIADFCSAEGLHFHVDAAWGGAVILSDKLKGHLAGIERADSITVDPHKWMSVPMGAGLFLCRDRSSLSTMFGTHTGYIPHSAEAFDEPFMHSPQWSRRFIGLKLFMSLAAAGREGYAAAIERQTQLGDTLRRLLTDRGWRIRNNTPLPLVCFSHPSLDDDQHLALAADIVSSGKAWISTTPLQGSIVLRACITSYRASESDLQILLDELDRALVAIGKSSTRG